ncbi:MAG: ATP synthase F0 subunit C [Bdellovibrionales bacterium]|nr:ATP synthase F0 subunit C [Bdellovibrionales bacterium]
MKKATFVTALLFSAQAFAQEAGHAAAAVGGDKGWYAIAVGIMLGLGVFGATMGQGRVGASAMEGLARNPQARNAMFVPMIVVLALIESLFILTWLIGQGLAGKI